MGKAFGGGQGKSEGIGQIFGQGGNIGKNIMKLAPIALGIGTAVTILGKMLQIATESSAHFAATSKLWDTSIRMIFRPMGDTIGLILRPFALMMLRWALPFYRDFTQNIDEITTGGEELSKGNVGSGIGLIGGGILDTLFGEGAGEGWLEQGKKWQVFLDTLFESFSGFSNWELMPQVMADTGEEFGNAQVAITGFKNELSLFDQVIKRIQTEINNRMTLEGLGIESGSDFTTGGQAGARSNRGTSNIMSRSDFNDMRKNVGNRATMEYLRSKGMSVGERNSGGDETGGINPRAGSGGITVNIARAVVDDPNLGRIIQEEIQRELKKLPGRR